MAAGRTVADRPVEAAARTEDTADTGASSAAWVGLAFASEAVPAFASVGLASSWADLAFALADPASFDTEAAFEAGPVSFEVDRSSWFVGPASSGAVLASALVGPASFEAVLA